MALAQLAEPGVHPPAIRMRPSDSRAAAVPVCEVESAGPVVKVPVVGENSSTDFGGGCEDLLAPPSTATLPSGRMPAAPPLRALAIMPAVSANRLLAGSKISAVRSAPVAS